MAKTHFTRAELAELVGPGDRPLAMRVNGRLVPGPGYSERDMFRIEKVGRRTRLVKIQPQPSALVYRVESEAEAAALKQDLMRQGKTGTILVVEPSEEEKQAREYVRRRAASQDSIGRMGMMRRRDK